MGVYLWIDSQEIIETYTVADAQNNIQFTNIYKSGYRIKSITFNSKGSCNSSSTWANYDIRIQDGENGNNYFKWWSWVGANESYYNKTHGLVKSINGTETTIRESANRSYGTTIVDIQDTIYADGTWESIYGEHTTTGDFSSDSTAMTLLNSLFTGNNTIGRFRTNNSGALLQNNVITVTYEPI